jgi:2'-5' RNA ligase
MTSHKRVFIGIPLTDDMRQACARIRDSLPTTPSIRWAQEANLHVTLFFIGKVDADIIPTLSVQLQEVGSATPPFELMLEEFVFMPTKRPRMIWAQFKQSEHFRELVRLLSERVGYLRNDEEFKEPLPHSTIAHFKYLAPRDRITLPAAPALALSVNTFNLYESHLSSVGSQYEVISEVQLR